MEGSTTSPDGRTLEVGGKREAQTKFCGKCQTSKPLPAFASHHKRGQQTNCRECMRRHQVARIFGISKEQYLRLLIRQNGACAICGLQLASVRIRRPDVDHCHKTGKIRGILCRNCNLALGLMKEHANRLRAAADYLDRNGLLCDDIVSSDGQPSAAESLGATGLTNRWEDTERHETPHGPP